MKTLMNFLEHQFLRFVKPLVLGSEVQPLRVAWRGVLPPPWNNFNIHCLLTQPSSNRLRTGSPLFRCNGGKALMLIYLAAFSVMAPGMASPVSASPTNTADATGAPFTISTDVMATLDDHHKLSIGDHLSFQIREDNVDSKQLIVSDSGEIDVPCLGPVPVQGLTCRRLALVLKKELEARYYYHATVVLSVDLMGSNLGNVYLSGAVHTPGRLAIPGNEVFTASKAVLCAGGFAESADMHNVIVTRNSEPGGASEHFTVDVGQVLEKGSTDKDLALKPGDMIFVPERFNLF
jgi:polysaccharide export outer membrane protein